MNFKPIVTLLVVGIFASLVAADFEEYDVATLRNMLRAQVQCPLEYSKYAASCQDKFGNDVNVCDNNENKAKSRLQKESLENRREFELSTNNSCNALRLCDNGSDEPGAVYGCYSTEASKGAIEQSGVHYRAIELQTAYVAAISTIGNTKTKCYEKCSKDLSDNTNKGMLELQKCMKNGKFNLAPIVTVVPEPTKAPVVTEPVAPVVTENSEAEA